MAHLGKLILLTTFLDSGEPVSSPVCNVPMGDGRIGVLTSGGTGKCQRIRTNPRVAVQTCTARGQAVPGALAYHGTAEITGPGPLLEEARLRLRARYRWLVPLVKSFSRLTGRRGKGHEFADTLVLIKLEEEGPTT